ncbi:MULTISPECIES: hypothetical protein [unclassified Leeuwenhoekiella]|uniref:hypothetical protein n=1 Tax=unclassified Leeuwenhoekiella TaxID=2615029 RepID=UPI000C3E664C|nr:MULTISPECIES: hypothetical protein [unclassified Leeuwenhoekiella]MAW95610.1 hypothetical protein [Leeuwenhoekiella sp.]MBA82298.1 hypothetical protein [Leeuwenhoekiella sp.]
MRTYLFLKDSRLRSLFGFYNAEKKLIPNLIHPAEAFVVLILSSFKHFVSHEKLNSFIPQRIPIINF